MYTTQWAEAGTLPVVKQYVGDFITTTGFEVHMRDMGTYNDTLFGDVLSDFNLQSNDVLLVSTTPLTLGCPPQCQRSMPRSEDSQGLQQACWIALLAMLPSGPNSN